MERIICARFLINLSFGVSVLLSFPRRLESSASYYEMPAFAGMTETRL